MLTKEQREEIRNHLEVLERISDGVLTPDAVVADARKKDSPLHNLSIWKGWDLRKSAKEFWIDQARELIRTVYVTVTNENITIRAPCYVRDPSANSDEQGYRRIQSIATDQDRAREVLIAEFKRVADILRRAREIAAVLGMAEDTEKLIAGVVGLRALVMQQPEARQ